MKSCLSLLVLYCAVIFLLIIVIIASFPITHFWNRMQCKISGKEFLTLTNNQNVCEDRHSDAGKSCQTSKECEGFCGYTQPEAVKNGEGYYYPESTENKGECSEYDNPNGCYKGIPNIKSSTYSLNDSEKTTIRICPPETL